MGVEVHEAGTRPVRVMHVLVSLRMGGTELGVVKLANALDPNRVETAICSCKPADSLKHRLSPHVGLFEFDRREGNDPWLVAQLVRLFRRERPDVVHTHAWGTLVEGLLAARLSRVPRVIHGEHGTMETRARNVRVQRFLWPRTDGILSVSSRLAERMASQIGFDLPRIRVIRNGIDTEKFHPSRRAAARAASGIPEQSFVVGTAGRLVPVKDQATLLAALARLQSQGVPFQCLIAGDGPLHASLSEQARASGLAESVRFLGARDDIEDVLAACDVFVLSSVSEGMSNAILEAMSTGLPVVATRVGAADELIEEGKTGCLVPPRDSHQLADALARLAVDTALRRSMASAARERALTTFPFGGMVAAYEQLYVSLVRGEADGRKAERICAV